MKTGQSLKDRHKKERQESLRELLSKQGHLQKVLENVTNLENLENQIDREDVARLKICIETRLKLLNKYLPDAKAVELDFGNDEGVKEIKITYE